MSTTAHWNPPPSSFPWWFCEQALGEIAALEMLSSCNVAREKWPGWALCCATQGPSTCVQVRTHCSLKHHDPRKGCSKYICLACCHFAAGCNLITSASLGQGNPGRTIQDGEKSIWTSWSLKVLLSLEALLRQNQRVLLRCWGLQGCSYVKLKAVGNVHCKHCEDLSFLPCWRN